MNTYDDHAEAGFVRCRATTVNGTSLCNSPGSRADAQYVFSPWELCLNEPLEFFWRIVRRRAPSFRAEILSIAQNIINADKDSPPGTRKTLNCLPLDRASS